MAASPDEMDALAAKFFGADPNEPSIAESVRVGKALTEDASKDYATLRTQGVALTADEGAGVTGLQRTAIGMRRGENLNRYLDETFGPGNHRLSEQGNLVLRDSKGNEFLADELGITSQDLKDFSDMGAPIAGAIGATAAGAALATSTPGVLMLSALSALGGAAGGTVADMATTSGIGPASAQRMKEIWTERGPEAAIDFVFGVMGGAAGKLINRGRTPTDVPGFGDAITPNAVSDAAQRVEQRTGMKFPQTAAERTGNRSLARMESIASKIPGAAEKFAEVRTKQDEVLKRLQEQLAGDTADAAPVAVGKLQQQADALQLEADTALKQTDEILQKELTDIGDSFTPNGKSISMEGAGTIRRNAAIREREKFRSINATQYNAFDRLGGNDLMVIDTKPLSRVEARIRSQLPKTAEGDVPNALMPANTRKFLSSLGQLSEKASIQEIRGLRTLVNNAIDNNEALPGVDQFFLKDISSTLTTMMKKGEEAIPDPNLRRLLKDANDYYKTNVAKFHEKGISDNFAPTTEGAFVENSALSRRVLREDGLRELQAAFGFMTDREKKYFARGVYNDWLSNAESVASPGKVDVEKLIGQIDAMPKKNRDIVFGDMLEPMARTLRLMRKSGQTNLDLNDIGDLSGNAVEMLRKAARAQRTRAVEYDKTVIGPFLKGELGASQLNPEDFVSHLLESADLSQIQQVMTKLGTNSTEADAVKRKVIQIVLNRAQRPVTADEAIVDLVQKEQPIIGGRQLLRVLTDVAGENTRKKLEYIIGQDGMAAIADIGILRAGRERLSDVGAAGGLISGGILNDLAQFKPAALTMLAWYRLQSVIMTNPAVLKVLRTQSQTSLREDKANVIVSQFVNDLGQEFKDEPGLVNFFMERLSGNAMPEFQQEPARPADEGAQLDDIANQFLSQ